MADCGCPPGSILVTLPNGTQACRQDTVYLAQGPSVNSGGCHKLSLGIAGLTQGPGSFGRSADYCKNGARFYGETAIKPFPISYVTGCTPGTQGFQDFSSTPLSLVGSASNALWGTGAAGPSYDGRFNLVGATIDPNNPCVNTVFAGSYGYTHCLNVATTTTYCFGFGGYNVQIVIDGGVFITSLAQDKDQYETWNVVQLTLPPGLHIIQMTAQIGGSINICGQASFATTNPFTSVGFAFEIYQATAAQLATFTNLGQLTPTIVYSTLNEAGQPMDYGGGFHNYRCPCDSDPASILENCPTPFGQFNAVQPVLDNCTINPLNPQGSPSIYVCHTYTYSQATECWFLLMDCQNPANTIKTDTNLTTYLGQVVTLAGVLGCWIVDSSYDCDGTEIPVTVTGSFDDCTTCLPHCFVLSDCAGIQPAIVTNTNLAAQIGNVVTLQGIAGCWIVSNSLTCDNAIAVTVVNVYSAGTGVPPCDLCNPPCFQLTDCENPANIIITTTNLTAYLGQVIQLEGCGPKTCWSVTRAVDCTGSVPVVVDTTFETCADCLPIVVPDPIILHNRKVKPGYKVSGSCSTEYVDKVKCNFAEEVYKKVKKRRYGISNCCDDNLLKYQIKNALLDLDMIYDPMACVKSPCCEPTCLTIEFKVYNTTSCPAPANVEVEFTIPITCPPPEDIGPIEIVFNNPRS